MKMLAAKKGTTDGKMNPDEMSAKLDVIKELLNMAHGAMGSKVKGGMDEMHKVSVMAPDQKGLHQGLDLASALAAGGGADENPDDMEGSDETADEEKSEDPAVEMAEEKSGLDLDGDKEEGESPDHVAEIMKASEPDEEENPFAKKRAMMGKKA